MTLTLKSIIYYVVPMCKPNISSSSLTREIAARLDAGGKLCEVGLKHDIRNFKCAAFPGNSQGYFDLLCYFTLITDSRISHWQNI